MKKFRLLITTIALSTMMSVTALAGEWKQDSKGWWYQNNDESYPVNCWQEINGKQYYFNDSGYLLTNTTTPDGKQVNSNGELVSSLFDLNLSKCHVTYLKYEISTDSDGVPCLILYYNFTNTSSESQIVPFVTYIKAYQNGKECDLAFLKEINQELENYGTSILPNTTLTIAETFKISDKSPVTLYIYDMNLVKNGSANGYQPTVITLNLQ